MKKLIEDYIKQNDSIHDFLNSKNLKHQQPDEVLPMLIEFLEQTKFNAALGVCFSNFLQLSNESKNFEQYELSDISKLLESLLKLQTCNLETYVDAANFEWAVMDDKDKAKQIASEGILRAKEKMEELQCLFDKIHKD